MTGPITDDLSFPTLRIGDEAPDFTARTTHGEFVLSSLRGRWVMLFAHPADFTPVCTSEFIALSKLEPVFRERDCVLLGLSADSLPAHLAWISAIEERFNVRVPFPIVEDPSMEVARAYGMIDLEAQNSATVRSVFFIDPTGIIRTIINYPASVGRSVAELQRVLCALQEVDRSNILTPEGWHPGEPAIAPPPQTQEAVQKAGPSWFLQPKKPRS
ncbi:peroxiredoxin [Gluconobacter thailandicus]|uniref:Alkyl hydroperoxide reductase C n=1 Tax=Gluconobacter thailandicus TaxID=257438 RepID=A0AAP9JHR9_GLUTH|nr:peroxiredoxin [Gluconobacter thailandicus]QEH96200.1 peroxiredoxin [Gluconobacter thailandicus]